jgi:ABC-type transport system substrate-binding protein
MYTGLIFDTQYILEHGGFGTPSGVNTYFNQNAIPGTGPYIPTAFEVGSYEKFTQNPTYWGNSLTPAEIQANPYLDPGHVKNVILYAKGDDVVRYTDLSTGAVQIASIYTQNWPLVVANPDKYSYFQMPSDSLIVVGIGMNVLRYPTNITAFRLAIVHAVNYTEVNQKVYFGTLVPMVGPEYRAEKDFYDLGNMPPYSYNLTLANQYLAQSGVDVSKLQPLEFRVMAGCTSCIAAAQVVQADLSAIGIPMNVLVTPPSIMTLPYESGYSSYQASVPYAQQEAHLSWMGFPTFAPEAPTPADAWVMFVSLHSPTGNFANYGNQIVENCVNAWFSTTDVTAIKDACTAAQLQVNKDAPYIWLGNPTLAFGGGSVVWDKTVVKGFLMDPDFTSQSTTAIFNTVTFVNS